MRYLLKFTFTSEIGNQRVGDPEFGHNVQKLLSLIKAEAAYFCPVDGQRGGYFVVNLEEGADIARTLEPIWFWLQADVELIPVMVPEDLMKAGPAIADAAKNWS